MGIEDIQISEELQTNAPSIKYSGNEGPKSPQQMQEMMMAQIEEEYSKYLDDMMEQGLDPMSFEQFVDQAMAEGQMSGGTPLPNDPTKPVNPFAPKPTGPTLPDRQMAAYGGIMGIETPKRGRVDGPGSYAGVGSWFQKNVMDPLKMEYYNIPDEGGPASENSVIKKMSQDRVNREPQGYENPLDTFFKGKRENPDDPDSKRTGGANQYILPAIGGALAGLFSKGSDPENPGKPDDDTALQLADLKKSANVLDQKQGLAANLNFLPSVASRKYSPTEMIEVYQNAANGGRIGYNLGGRIGMAEGGIMDLGGMEKDYRNTGGFVDIGEYEKKDDVPARLSVNEFVMTADAVRGMGDGDIDLGAKRMENLMGSMENKKGAQQMFDVSERLSEVI